MPRVTNETRDRISSDEITAAWEELYLKDGPPPLETLASWLAAPEEVVIRALPHDMHIDDKGELIREGYFAQKRVPGFDKFMDKILVSEGHFKPVQKEQDSPQRRRAALHQDRPLNKIRYGSK